VCGSFDFANPPVPVIKSFQNERTASSGVLKNFKIKEPFILGFGKISESMNLEFQVFENSQRTGGLYEGQAKNSEFRVGSLTQSFDFVEPQIRVETGSTTSENHWLRVKTSNLTFDNCWSRVHMMPYHYPHETLSTPIKLCVALVSLSSVPHHQALCGTCFIELCTPSSSSAHRGLSGACFIELCYPPLSCLVLVSLVLLHLAFLSLHCFA